MQGRAGLRWRPWLLAGAAIAIAFGVAAFVLDSDEERQSGSAANEQAEGGTSGAVLAAAKGRAGEKVLPLNPLAVRGAGRDRASAPPRREAEPVVVEPEARAKRQTGSLRWIPNGARVKRGEALPCTGPDDPVNFEVFSAGTAVGGLKLS